MGWTTSCPGTAPTSSPAFNSASQRCWEHHRLKWRGPQDGNALTLTLHVRADEDVVNTLCQWAVDFESVESANRARGWLRADIECICQLGFHGANLYGLRYRFAP